jgi:hypothetical protein
MYVGAVIGFGSALAVGLVVFLSQSASLPSPTLAVAHPPTDLANGGDLGVSHAGWWSGTSGGNGASQNSSICAQWDLASDFRVFPNQENPNRDSCSNPDVWHFMQSTDLSRDLQTYSLLPDFVTTAFSIEGLEEWYGPDWNPPEDGLPHIGTNTTGVTQYVNALVWPPNVILAHPSARLAIVGWQSPLAGRVAITGSVTDIDDGCGDGVLWYIDKGATNLASGSVPNGGSQGFVEGTGGTGLADVVVDEGEFIYVVVHPNADFGCDSTGLDISITPYYIYLPLVLRQYR